MKYDSYSYIYPTRPKNTIPRDNIKYWDNNTMLAQPKLNGSNCLIFTNGFEYRKMNRHGEIITNFNLKNSELSILHEPFEMGKWVALNGEYLNKAKNDETGNIFNHKFVLFDILVSDSEYLIGKTFQERFNLLNDIYRPIDCEKDYLCKISDNIYIIKPIYHNFLEEYDKLTRIDLIEGLVMKRKNAKLEIGSSENNNTRSQIKSRKPTKNYKF